MMNDKDKSAALITAMGWEAENAQILELAISAGLVERL